MKLKVPSTAQVADAAAPPPPAPTPPSPLTRERISALILTVNTRAADDALGKLVVDDLVSSLQRLIALEQQLSHRSADARDALRRAFDVLVMVYETTSHRHDCSASQGSERDCTCRRATIHGVITELRSAMQGGGGGE